MLNLEVLEGREVPASAVLLGGNLIVLGDFLAPNDIRLDPAGPAGQVSLYLNGQTSAYAGVTNLVVVGGNLSDDIANNTAVPSTLFGLGGDDALVGGTGADSIFGGRGDDVLYDLLGTNFLHAGGGDDRVYKNATSAALTDAGDLLVNFFAPGRTPGAGSVTLEAGVLYVAPSNAGTRTVIDRDGDQVVVSYDFGAGLQTAAFPADQVRAIAYFGGAGADLYANHTDIEEAAYGSAGNDVILSGTGAFNLLKGSGGDDVLVARGRRADLTGNGGADLLASLAPVATFRVDALDVIFSSGLSRIV